MPISGRKREAEAVAGVPERMKRRECQRRWRERCASQVLAGRLMPGATTKTRGNGRTRNGVIPLSAVSSIGTIQRFDWRAGVGLVDRVERVLWIELIDGIEGIRGIRLDGATPSPWVHVTPLVSRSAS
jgi:hypothetical protein